MGKIIIIKGEGGLGRREPSKDMVSGLMMGGVAATGLALDVTSDELKRPEDAVALGIDDAYDIASNILVYHHIKEFFRLNTSGSLYIRLTAQGTTLAAMCDKANAHVTELLKNAKGDIRQVGVILNPVVAYVVVPSGGLDADVLAAIPKAQELAAAELLLKRPVQVVVEGRSFNGTVAAATDLRTLDSENVHVIIAAEPTVSAIHAIHAGYAAVGVMMGAISKAFVHENIGWTTKFDLSDRVNGLFLNPGLSSNVLASTEEANYETLTQKGYTFAKNHVGQAGTFFDDFPTCQVLTSDFAFGENQRTIQKAIRLVYDALFPRINSPIKINPDNGTMEIGIAKSFEADAEEALRFMQSSGEVSDLDAFVDPAQDVLGTSIVQVKISIVPLGTARVIEITLGFTKSI